MADGEQPDPAPRRELSDVLAEEFQKIKGDARVKAVGDDQPLQVALDAAAAAARARKPPPSRPDIAAELARRKVLYRIAHRLELSALCLSGGGIRSAALSLGVIQALADHNLLDKFNYLSTVSGGGYIGSWLSAWLYRVRKFGHGKSSDVLDRLGARRNPDVEVPPLDHLREYSNYLTPKLGLFSADTWASLAIVLRNIVVNWLILVPVLAILVTFVKLAALALTAPAYPAPSILPPGWTPPPWTWVEIIIAVTCLLCGGLALGYKLGRLYLPAYSQFEHPGGETLADREANNAAQSYFIRRSLVPAMIGGLCFVWLAFNQTMPGVIFAALFPNLWAPVPMACFAASIYAIALLVGHSCAKKLAGRGDGAAHPFDIDWKTDGVSWLPAVGVFALMIWVGARFISWIGDPATNLVSFFGVAVQRETLIVIFGMPWFLQSTMLAHTIYLLMNSASRRGEVEREWLGRASGWHFIAGLAWIMLSAVVLLGPALYYNIPKTVHVLTVVSGTVTGLLGKSGLASATGASSDWKGFAANIGLALAGPLFAVLLLILLSVVIDWAVFGYLLPCLPPDGRWDRCRGEAWWWPFSWSWLLPLGVSAIVLLTADFFANINAFSLHAIYRNRLIRCFLGGARDPHRHPDGFTDFDWDDDMRVAELWSSAPAEGEWRPFHVINMTLNLAATNRLAWQQRKAMPFSVTPFFCGNADLGYRRTEYYGGPHLPPGPDGEIRSGISLGTAVAISGAAVSSNMGYHSSMSLSFLLTFFNVRLGVWLGNTGGKWRGKRAPYTQPGPRFAVPSLLRELFGMTTDESPYVYLSDGGHFEDLGLYEMVRRRCKWIVVVDGDQDGKRGFADLGNAVRKIWIDLGVRITFNASDLLAAEQDAKLKTIPYFAVGTVTYVSDPRDVDGRMPEGKILYIKPVVRGDEPAADLIAYKRAYPTFPAQSTANQWFDESQFESYRRLGHLMIENIIGANAAEQDARVDLAVLLDGLQNINRV